MYSHPFLGIYGMKDFPKRKRGRPSNRSKFLEKQVDMFSAELFTARLASARLPARSEARTDSRALPNSGFFMPADSDGFSICGVVAPQIGLV